MDHAVLGVRRRRGGLAGPLGQAGRRAAGLVPGVGHDPRVGTAVRQVVRGRPAQRQRTTAWTATWRRGGATRWPTTGRASRATPAPSDLRRAVSTRSTGSPTCCKGRWASSEGDRVGIYMPMIPELPVAMLACTRIGAAHSVHLRRLLVLTPSCGIAINDAQAKVIVTADGGLAQGEAPALLKPAAGRGGERPLRRSPRSWWCNGSPATRPRRQGPRWTWSRAATTGTTT